MHRLTSDRIKWGRAAFLAGLALSAVYLPGQLTRRTAPGTVPMMSLARRLPPEHAPNPQHPCLWPGLLSPDGKWELNWEMGGDSASTVVAQDRSRSITRKLRGKEFWTSASDKIWTPDSRSWVGLLNGAKSLYAVVQGLVATAAVRKLPLGYPKGTVEWPDLMASDLLGFIGADRVLAWPSGGAECDRPGETCKIPFYDFRIGPAGGRLHQYEIALPKGVNLGEVALSPRGDRLAWILYRGARGKYGAMEAQTIELALSRDDGGAMQIIGTLPREPGELYYRLRRLAWLPDGAHVSLTYERTRWSVPVAP